MRKMERGYLENVKEVNRQEREREDKILRMPQNVVINIICLPKSTCGTHFYV